MSKPFLCSKTTDAFCPICSDAVTLRSEEKHKKTYSFKNDLKTLKSQAEKWRTIDLPENNTFYSFKTAL